MSVVIPTPPSISFLSRSKDADDAVLCVDLDGTLIEGDTLRLAVGGLIRRRPGSIGALLLAALGGRVAFKRAVAKRHRLDPARLRFRATVVDFVRKQKVDGRRVVLASGTHQDFAEAAANRLGCFDYVLATHSRGNLTGTRKVAAIRELIGDSPFDYMGDSWVDLPVFAAAARAYLVAPSAMLLARARKIARVERIFDA